MHIRIVGLGPGAVEDLSLRAWRALEAAPRVYLRTERHPCVPHLPPGVTYESFDHLYNSLPRFEDVYLSITQRLLEAARSGQTVVYAVPGDPLVGEATVGHLLKAAAEEKDLRVEIISGISFIEPALALLGVDALDGLQIIDGLTVAAMYHPPLNPDYPALLAQVYSRAVASEIKLTLMNQYPDEFEVHLLHAAGTAQAAVETVPLYAIDRSERIDHLTSLYLPALGEMSSFEAFQDIIAHLRAPDGCPWDREQTHESLRPFLLEEAYEVLEAIESGDMDALAGELGDLLLQVVLHTQIAIDEGEFSMADVLGRVSAKMIRRHPHVWSDVDVGGDSGRVLANWEQIKQEEKTANGEEPASLLDGIPRALPALMVAHKYQAKAARVGFDWPDVSGVEDKIREELDEIFGAATDAERAREIGDLLFVLVNWLRWLGVDDPEGLLRETNAKFYRRFRYIEQAAGRPLKGMTLEQMDALWDEAKTKGL